MYRVTSIRYKPSQEMRERTWAKHSLQRAPSLAVDTATMSSPCTLDTQCDACQPQVARVSFTWGLRVFRVGTAPGALAIFVIGPRWLYFLFVYPRTLTQLPCESEKEIFPSNPLFIKETSLNDRRVREKTGTSLLDFESWRNWYNCRKKNSASLHGASSATG